MKCRMWLAGALVALLWATPARADNSFIVRSRLSLQALQTACTPLLLPPICKVVRGLGDPQLFLITSPLDLNGLLNLVGNPLGILDAEIDQLLSLIGGLNLLPAPIPATLMSDRSSVPYGGTNVWNSYANQTAAGIVEVQNALKSFNVTGTGIVADIDTGVDPTHPVHAEPARWFRAQRYFFFAVPIHLVSASPLPELLASEGESVHGGSAGPVHGGSARWERDSYTICGVRTRHDGDGHHPPGCSDGDAHATKGIPFGRNGVAL